MMEKIKTWLRHQWYQLRVIEDTPLQKSLGFGLGVFLGNFPGMGPIAALIASWLFRVNRAAALLGSVLTNTWMTIATLGFSISVGSWITSSDRAHIQAGWNSLIHDFHWSKLQNGEILNILYPTILGYILVSFIIAVSVTVMVFIVLTKKNSKSRIGKLHAICL